MQQNKSTHTTNPLILLLIIVMGVVAGYVFYGQAGDSVAPALPAAASDSAFVKFKNLKFDFTLFQNQSFADLKTYGQTPITPGTTGRQDVFAPWQ